MSRPSRENRAFIDVPADVHLAVRLRALKDDKTTQEIVTDALMEYYVDDIMEARDIIAKRPKKEGKVNDENKNRNQPDDENLDDN